LRHKWSHPADCQSAIQPTGSQLCSALLLLRDY
jgi:hypothetical protein